MGLLDDEPFPWAPSSGLKPVETKKPEMPKKEPGLLDDAPFSWQQASGSVPTKAEPPTSATDLFKRGVVGAIGRGLKSVIEAYTPAATAEATLYNPDLLQQLPEPKQQAQETRKALSQVGRETLAKFGETPESMAPRNLPERLTSAAFETLPWSATMGGLGPAAVGINALSNVAGQGAEELGGGKWARLAASLVAMGVGARAATHLTRWIAAGRPAAGAAEAQAAIADARARGINLEQVSPELAETLRPLRPGEGPNPADVIRSETFEVPERAVASHAAIEQRAAEAERTARAAVGTQEQAITEAVAGRPTLMTPQEAGEALSQLPKPRPVRGKAGKFEAGKPLVEPGQTAEEIVETLRFDTPKQIGEATRFVQGLKRNYGADSQYVQAAAQGIYARALAAENPAEALLRLAASSLGKEAFPAPVLARMRAHAAGIRDLDSVLERIATQRNRELSGWAATYDPEIGGTLQGMFRRLVTGQATADEIQAGIFGAISQGAKPEQVVRMLEAVGKISGREAVDAIRMGTMAQLLRNLDPTNATRAAIEPFIAFMRGRNAQALFGPHFGEMQRFAERMSAIIPRIERAATPQQAQEAMREMGRLERSVLGSFLRRHPTLQIGAGAGAGEFLARLAETIFMHPWSATKALLKTAGIGLAALGGIYMVRGGYRALTSPEAIQMIPAAIQAQRKFQEAP